MIQTLKDLEVEIESVLHALSVSYKIHRIMSGISFQFAIDDFGMTVCGIDRASYAVIDNAITNKFIGYKKVYFTVFDKIPDIKDEIVWELMISGYMLWLRSQYPRQFKNLIVNTNFGNRIIEERFRRWDDKRKYKFWIDYNKEAQKQAATFVLSQDPGFFDMMPDIPKEKI